MRILLSLFFAVLAPLAALSQTIAITNGRVVTNNDAGDILDRATVVVRNGQIVAVGESVPVPEGARIIDASGQWITPGLFAPFTRLGLVEISAEDPTNDTSAATSTLNASLDVADAFNPMAASIPIARLEGVTRAVIVPSAGSEMIAGQGGIASLTGHEDSLYAERSFLYIEFGQRGAALSGGSRASAWAHFRAAINDARNYPAQYMAHVEGDVLRRADAAAFREYLRGEEPILVRADRASDIRRLINYARENADTRFILVGGAEAGLVAEELAAARMPVIFDPLINLPGSLEQVGTSLATARRLAEAGVTFAFSTESAADGDRFNVRLLPQHAGNAAAHGLGWADAFKAISRTPAEIFGQGSRFGQLATGYAADIVVWDGDPLEVASAPTRVLIDGALQPMTSRQLKLAQRYLDLPAPDALSSGYNKPE